MILSPEQARKPRRVAGRASGSAGRAKLLFLLVWRDTGAGPKQPFEPVQGRTSDKLEKPKRKVRTTWSAGKNCDRTDEDTGGRFSSATRQDRGYGDLVNTLHRSRWARRMESSWLYAAQTKAVLKRKLREAHKAKHK